ncbi:sensor histidine kinase [Sandaracinobacteroides saxicola]|uniref:histidine kinase n=1 Tax=Sandaracinobacteroides saxicola TaxID=2759707 RepID=A0A7G5ILB5_9SPHN|nr:HAMP domain-containing sensor histidine kinase [Sandaracinobacteroides saxicola]QMW24157.1 HAMP domain-containing histidine kinase [Sandaracinobacteroides saxicola]
MRRPHPILIIQLLGMIIVLAAQLFAHAQLADPTPPLTRAASWAVVAGLLLFWLALTPRLMRFLAAGDLHATDRIIRRVLWVGSLGLVIQFIILFPWLTTEVQLTISAFSIGTVAIQALATVDRPPVTSRPSPMPLVIPAGLIGWYLFHAGPVAIATIILTATMTAILLLLRGTVQAQVNRAHTAVLAAEAARAEVEAERDARTRFIAAAWHDLGQPIQAARLFSDQAARGSDPAHRAKAAADAAIAFESVERQLRSMLDHLQLEGSRTRPALVTLPAGRLIDGVARLHAAAAAHAGIRLIVLPSRAAVRADPDLAQRALSNLVDNAIRHARARRILIGARRHGACLQFWVIDDGRATGQATAGFGLGLPSSHRIAALLGGTLRRDPRWCNGAAFRLELPMA